MTARAAAVKKRVVIEQAIARGETVIAMCRRLRVSEDDVVEVWMRMEKLCTEHIDYVLPPSHRRRCAS